MNKRLLKLIALFSFVMTSIILCVTIKLDKDSIKELFTPINKTYLIDNAKSKTIINQGIEKEVTTKTYHSNLGYKIDFDVNLFKPYREDGLDKFTFISDEDVYFTIEKISKEDFSNESSSPNLVYKKVGKLYLAIKIYCPEDPDYQNGIYNRIIYEIDEITAE